MDKYLFDVPLAEYFYHREYRPRLHLRLGDLPDDRTAIKMTGFNMFHATLVPSLTELPFNICGFIDDTIDPILVPFSGPAGDYEGAPR